jgi:hypothetical protein
MVTPNEEQRRARWKPNTTLVTDPDLRPDAVCQLAQAKLVVQ